MAPKGLDLQQAPPLSVPLRFFLTAPVFAFLAGLVALWQGPDLFASRWSPGALAATHLVALGCVTMVMAGALMQILPVLVGATIARPVVVASLVHAGLVSGTLALAGAFLSREAGLFVVAAVLLGAAVVVFLAAIAQSLVHLTARQPMVRLLWLVAAALAVAVVLGAWLAVRRAMPVPFAAALADLHPAWALLGWVGLLVVAIAQRVVPMFQLTPDYPGWTTRRLAMAIVVALGAWSVARASGSVVGSLAAAAALATLYAAFAATTLILQRKRKRRQADFNLRFWRAGMTLAIAAAVAWVVASAPVPLPPSFPVTVGVLAIVGAAVSLVAGMLYRIVPFLAWFHLFARAGASPAVPHLKQYLGDAAQRRHFVLHAASLALLLAATLRPHAFAHVAALAFAASALAWLANLIAIVRVYTRHLGIVARIAEGHAA